MALINADEVATFVTTFRTDIRKVATIVKWLHVEGNAPTSRSDALAKALDTLVAMVLSAHPEYETKTVTEAMELLLHYGLVDTTKMRNISTLVKSLSGESLHAETANSILEDELLKAAQARLTEDRKQLTTMGVPDGIDGGSHE